MRISDWSSDVCSSDLNPFGKEQKAEKWSDVDPSLPNSVISSFVPPSTSGTRDAFSDLIMEKGCASDPAMKALKESDEDKYKEVCTMVREDRSEEHTSELQSLMRISYAVFCLIKQHLVIQLQSVTYHHKMTSV